MLGIKWDAIDFERNTITIRHTVTESKNDGKRILVAKDSAKTKSSLRSLPLVTGFREKLLQLKKQQKENMMVCGTSYNSECVFCAFHPAENQVFQGFPPFFLGTAGLSGFGSYAPEITFMDTFLSDESPFESFLEG